MGKCSCEIKTQMVGVPYPMYVDNRIIEAVPETVIAYCPLHAAAPEMLAFIKRLDFGNDCGCPFERNGEPTVDHETDCIEVQRTTQAEKLISRAEGKGTS